MMATGASVCLGLAVFDGREAQVFVGDLTPSHARVRAIGGAMLPDRFRLQVKTLGVDAGCVVKDRRGKLYIVAFG